MIGTTKVATSDKAALGVENSLIHDSSVGSFYDAKSPARLWWVGGICFVSFVAIGVVLLTSPVTATNRSTVKTANPVTPSTAASQRDYSRVSPLDLPRVRLDDADALFEQDKFEQAVASYSAARQDAFQVHDSALAALSMRRQAFAVFEAGRQQGSDRLKEAAELLGQAMELHRQLKLDNEVLQDRMALAGLYIHRDTGNDGAEALRLLNEVSVSLNKLPAPSPVLQRSVSLRIGYLQRHTQGDVDASLETYQKIFAAIPADEDPGAKADVLYRITERYLDKLQWNAAQETLKDSLSLWAQMQAEERDGMSREALVLRSEAQSAYGLALELASEYDNALLVLVLNKAGRTPSAASMSTQRKTATQFRSVNDLQAHFSAAANPKVDSLMKKIEKVQALVQQLQRQTPAQVQREDVRSQALWPGQFAQLTLQRIQGQNILDSLKHVQQLNSDPEADLLIEHADALYLLSTGKTSEAKEEAMDSERNASEAFKTIPLLNLKLSQLQDITHL